MKRLVLAVVLASTPLAAWAQCTRSEQAMTCVEGLVWDPATSSCVPIVIG